MTTLALPADTVQFYIDGPDFAATPLLEEAKRAYLCDYASPWTERLLRRGSGVQNSVLLRGRKRRMMWDVQN